MNDANHYLLERQAVQAAGEQDGNPFFCQHLSDLNETQKVLVSEDICNEQGAVILKKGDDLTERRAQMIVKHRLIKPIEQCIALEKTYGPSQLFKYLKSFGATVPGLHQVMTTESFETALKSMCAYYGKFPLIKQNITVLATRLPNIYNNSVFTALAGLAIARQMQLPLREQQTVFMAALLHDCGFLYIPHHLATKTQDFTAQEWHSLLAHPIIAKRFIDSVPDLPKEVGTTVLDHHERTDGTGFPQQKFGDELSRASQIIGIADDIVTAYHAYKKYGEHTHNMILSALKLNDNLHFEQVFKATAILFQKSQKPSSPPPQHASATQLLARHQHMEPHFEMMRTLSRQLIAKTKHPLNRSIAAMLGRLAISIVRSGLMQEEHETWLAEIIQRETDEDIQQLLETSVMYDQVDAQLAHLKNLLSRVIDDMPPEQAELKAQVQRTFTAIEQASFKPSAEALDAS